jgi:hypothetical protein
MSRGPVSSRHDARSQVAVAEEGLQILEVAVNILNRQSWTANKGWWVGWKDNKPACYYMLHWASDFDIWPRTGTSS